MKEFNQTFHPNSYPSSSVKHFSPQTIHPNSPPKQTTQPVPLCTSMCTTTYHRVTYVYPSGCCVSGMSECMPAAECAERQLIGLLANWRLQNARSFFSNLLSICFGVYLFCLHFSFRFKVFFLQFL